VVAIIYPSTTFASLDSMDWASLAAGDTDSVDHSSSCARHLVLHRERHSQGPATACRVRELAIAACSIAIVSLLETKMQASATSKVDDRVARTCFKVKVSTYIATTQDKQATFTSKAVRTCSDWEPSTYQDLSRLAEVQIFTALTADE